MNTNKTLVNINPPIQPGDGYLVKLDESGVKVVVTIDDQTRAVMDDKSHIGTAYCYEPQKIKKDEAKDLVKKTIEKIKAYPKPHPMDKLTVGQMEIFYKEYFEENT